MINQTVISKIGDITNVDAGVELNNDNQTFVQSFMPTTDVFAKSISFYPYRTGADVAYPTTNVQLQIYNADPATGYPVGSPIGSTAVVDAKTLPDWYIFANSQGQKCPLATWNFLSPITLMANQRYAIVYSVSGSTAGLCRIQLYNMNNSYLSPVEKEAAYKCDNGVYTPFQPLIYELIGDFIQPLRLSTYLSSVVSVPRGQTQSFYTTQSGVIDYMTVNLRQVGTVAPPNDPQIQIFLYENFRPAFDALPVTQLKAVSHPVRFSQLQVGSPTPVVFTFPSAVTLNANSCYTFVVQVTTIGLSSSSSAPYIIVDSGLDFNPVSPLNTQLNSAGLYGSTYIENKRHIYKVMLAFQIYAFTGGSVLRPVQANTNNLVNAAALPTHTLYGFASTFDPSISVVNAVDVPVTWSGGNSVNLTDDIVCEIREALPDPLLIDNYVVGDVIARSTVYSISNNVPANTQFWLQFQFRHAIAMPLSGKLFIFVYRNTQVGTLYLQGNREYSFIMRQAYRSNIYQPWVWINVTPMSQYAIGFILYAYENMDYSVTYDENAPATGVTDGAVPVDTNTYYFSDAVTVLTNPRNLSNSLWDLTGWGFSPSATTPDFAFNTPTTTIPPKFHITGMTTLYAVWRLKPFFNFTYNANFPSSTTTSGTVPVDGNTYQHGDIVQIQDNVGNLGASNHFLAGWAYNASASTPDFRITPAGLIPATVTLTDYTSTNYVLYAVWKPISSTLGVTYIANFPTAGGQGSPPIDPNSYTTGQQVTVLGNVGIVGGGSEIVMDQSPFLAKTNPYYLRLGPSSNVFAGMACGFTGNGMPVSRVSIMMQRDSATGGTAVARIYEDYDALITNTPLATSQEVQATSFPVSKGLVDFVFLTPPMTVSGKQHLVALEQGTLHTGGYSGCIVNDVYPDQGGSGREGYLWLFRNASSSVWYDLSGNGNAAGMSFQFILYGLGTAQPPLSLEGYMLTGWGFSPSATTPDFEFDQNNNDEPVPDQFTIIDSSPLYGFWSPVLSVTYDGNGADGGSVPVDLKNYLAGQQVTVLKNMNGLSHTQHLLLGWSPDPNASLPDFTFDPSGQNLSPSAFLIGTVSVTLYAIWRQMYLPPPDNHGTWLIEAQEDGVYQPQHVWRLDHVKKELASCGGKIEASLTTPNSPVIREFLKRNLLGRWRISYNSQIIFQGVMTERNYSNTEINIRLVDTVLANIILTGGLLNLNIVQSNAFYIAQQILNSVAGVSVGTVPNVIISVNFSNVTVWEAVRKFAEALGTEFYTNSTTMTIHFQPRPPRLFTEPTWLTTNKRTMNDLNKVDTVQVFGMDQNGQQIMGQYPAISGGIIRAFSSPTARNIASLQLLAQYQHEQLNNPSTNGNTLSVLTHFMYFADAGDYVLVNQSRLNFVSPAEGFLIHRVTLKPTEMTLDIDSPTPLDIKLLSELSAQKISNASTTILPTQVK
jgi:hypothetical protein